MYPDMSYAENSGTDTLVLGVAAPPKTYALEIFLHSLLFPSYSI